MAQPQPSDGFEWTQEPWGAALRCRPLLPIADHVFTAGNLELRDDAREWAAVADVMGVPVERLLLLRQVHRADAAVARRARQAVWVRPEADLIVSDDPSVAIGIRVADCAPILIADDRRHVVAAVHAGWRGTVQRAAVAGVRRLGAEFGSEPRDLIAAIGPCLGPCCGEVGEEVVEAFREAGHERALVDRWFSPGPAGRPHLDLWRATRDQLEGAGMAPSRIHTAGLCTKTHSAVFHSYRAERERAGRMVAAIRAS